MPTPPSPPSATNQLQPAAEILGDRILAGLGTMSATGPVDWGVPLLARLRGTAAGSAAAIAWAALHGRASGRPALFGRGLAGRTLGITHAAAVAPRLEPVARLAVQRLADSASRTHRRDLAPPVCDYDLVTGASGIALALCTSMDLGPDLLPAALTTYLTRLADDDELTRLRVGDHDVATYAWNVGRVNLGLAHGAPGVLAALLAILPHVDGPEPADGVRSAAGRIARFLVRHSHHDALGVVGWPPAAPGAVGRPTRQAWCYGTPGVAWQLAEAGRLLDDTALREFAADAMASLASAWDDDVHLDLTGFERHAFCHGGAGVLLAADAFAIHTGSVPARLLADHLAVRLVERTEEVGERAATDPNLHTGAAGVVAALLSRSPATRYWLPAVALR